MKPENILVSGTTAKLADYGLAREIRSRPPYTDYVSTRWYRAPELLLRSTSYNSPVDVFAVGAIMAEMLLGRPLFPGQNEADQLLKVFSVLGSPSTVDWPEGHKMAHGMGYKFPEIVATPLNTLLPDASEEVLELMNLMMNINPNNRPNAKQCLEHRFFKDFKMDEEVKSSSKGFKRTISKNFDGAGEKNPYYNQRLKSRKTGNGRGVVKAKKEMLAPMRESKPMIGLHHSPNPISSKVGGLG